jgi:hypothetical protein
MKISSCLFLSALVSTMPCPGAAKVRAGHSPADKGFRLDAVPPPATNDAATDATFSLIDGRRDGNGGEVTVLHDGMVPWGQDEPGRNFFFTGDGGRLRIDLGEPVSIRSVHSYSWHPRERGPQVYKLYAAVGNEKDFAESPDRSIDPRSCGWKPIARVDTTRKGGGQFAVGIANSTAAPLGEFRYLLFDVEPTRAGNSQTNTFFSEIDVIATDGPAPIPTPERVLKTYASGKYTYTVDATLAPDLVEWVEKSMIPLVREWYPKLVAMLPSDGYTAPENVVLEFRDDMGGTPAYAAGNKLSMSAPWFRNQLKGEAMGCVIHELVHIVQNYWRARSTNPNPSPTPGWVTEGIPDYIRWFLYEPQSKGAEITRGNFERSNYDGSYRISANFLNWLVKTHDQDFVRKLNAAAREGRYSDEVWKESTGKTAAELGAEWKRANAKRLGIGE